MFSNLKGDFPFLTPPQSRKMGKDLTFSLAVSTEKQKKNAPPNHQRTENDPSSDKGCWAPCFSRRLNDWEVEIVGHFLLGLQGRRVCKDIDDKVM